MNASNGHTFNYLDARFLQSGVLVEKQCISLQSPKQRLDLLPLFPEKYVASLRAKARKQEISTQFENGSYCIS